MTDTAALYELLANTPDTPDPATARRLIDGTLDVLDEALRLALDVADAIEGVNLPELLRAALSAIAEDLGGEETLVRHRSGSWEAEHVRSLGMVLR